MCSVQRWMKSVCEVVCLRVCVCVAGRMHCAFASYIFYSVCGRQLSNSGSASENLLNPNHKNTKRFKLGKTQFPFNIMSTDNNNDKINYQTPDTNKSEQTSSSDDASKETINNNGL